VHINPRSNCKSTTRTKRIKACSETSSAIVVLRVGLDDFRSGWAWVTKYKATAAASYDVRCVILGKIRTVG
ncbi:MAG: hypothetical protein ACRERD_07035, partial [Candidatus Binatia bacterium]